MSRSINEILDEARRRLVRLDPEPAHLAARTAGAVLVDTRPIGQRDATGTIPGAVVIDRNVLEWRLDPRSDARLPFADSYDTHYILFCQQGYSSSLAAASLQEIGLRRATDLAGGFVAWLAAGLPVLRPAPSTSTSDGCGPGEAHPRRRAVIR